jgi:hypothetical protein
VRSPFDLLIQFPRSYQDGQFDDVHAESGFESKVIVHSSSGRAKNWTMKPNARRPLKAG